MALNTSFATLNALGDEPLIAGGTFTLKFTVLDQSGGAVDLAGAVCTVKFAPYGQSYMILSKSGSIIATNIFEIVLSPTDTRSWSGKYSYQPTITFLNGIVVIPSQGILTVQKGIN